MKYIYYLFKIKVNVFNCFITGTLNHNKIKIYSLFNIIEYKCFN